jgi:ubiquinone/menaquinone biosynthesis C-methylase UbiE
MSTDPAPAILPDFNKLAAQFDLLLPFKALVGEAIFDRLPRLLPGTHVLDLACGTGEPGLSLIQRHPGISLLGVDAAAAMIEAARRKVTDASLPNARFEVMSMQMLDIETSSVDVVISRFGFMMMEDWTKSVAEMARVLQPGGHYCFATWDQVRFNLLLQLSLRVLRNRVPEAMYAFMLTLDELAAHGRREAQLREAGMTTVITELFSWEHLFSDFNFIWDAMTRSLEHAFSQMSAEQREDARLQLQNLLAPYRTPDGAYLIRNSCRLFWGER